MLVFGRKPGQSAGFQAERAPETLFTICLMSTGSASWCAAPPRPELNVDGTRSRKYFAARNGTVLQSAVTSKSRITVNLETADYREFQSLAKEHNVSMAWLGRRAIALLFEQSRQRALPFPLSASRERPADP